MRSSSPIFFFAREKQLSVTVIVTKQLHKIQIYPEIKPLHVLGLCQVLCVVKGNTKEETLISIACFIGAGCLLIFWISFLLKGPENMRLNEQTLYINSVIIGGTVFGLIWLGLNNLFSLFNAELRKSLASTKRVRAPKKAETPLVHETTAKVLISEPKLTRKQKLTELLLISGASFVLIDSILTYQLTTSLPKDSWVPIMIQLFVSFIVFGSIYVLLFKRKEIRFLLRGKETRTSVLAIKYRRKRLIGIIEVIFVISTIFGGLVAAKVVFNTPTPFAVVQGTSMLPTLREGDIIIIQGVEPENIAVGEIIAFKPPSEFQKVLSPLIFHRVTDKIIENGKLYFRTKGDNTPPDAYNVPFTNVVGIYRGGIPYIGSIFLFLGSSGGYAMLLVLLAASFLYGYFPKKRKPNELKNQKTSAF